MHHKTKHRLRQLVLGSVQLCAVVAIVGGTFAVASYLRGIQPQPIKVTATDAPPLVSVITAQAAEYTSTIEKLGTIEPAVYINLVPEVSGVVVGVSADLAAGKQFVANDILFELSAEELANDLGRKQAERDAAAAALELEQAEGERAENEWRKFGKGPISDLAARGPQIRSAAAKLAIAQAWLETAQDQLARREYSLPFDGAIVDHSLAEGQYLMAGQSYGRSYQTNAVDIRLSLSPSELATIGSLNDASVQLQLPDAADNQSFSGRVTRVGAEADRSTRLLTVFVRPEQALRAHPGYKPGLFVNVSLSAAQPLPVIRLPGRALQMGNQVWLIQNSRLVKKTDINVAGRQRDSVFLTGVDAGEKVVLDVPTGATEGMTVETLAVSVPDSNSAIVSGKY
ncbi:MAG: efflux RND transporter periplasmic adaptor subunit [Pseudomonadota bacterium]